EICEQDVWLGLPDPLALLLAFLTRVPGKGWLDLLWKPRLVEVLLELLHLAVGQRVHGVDDDRLRARRLACKARSDGTIYDGDEEAKGLAGARPGRNNKALSRCRLRQRLRLMQVQI